MFLALLRSLFNIAHAPAFGLKEHHILAIERLVVESERMIGRKSIAGCRLDCRLCASMFVQVAVIRSDAFYNLSTDQQNQVKPILMDQQQRMQLLRLDSSLSPEEKKAKMQSIRSDSNAKIEAILNDDQKKQFEQDHQSMQERTQQRPQGGGPGGGGPPPQQ